MLRLHTVRSRAPLRISFAGGGTDVPPYPERFGGAVLGVTIDRYAYCVVSDPRSDSYRVKSADLDLEEIYPALGELSYGGKLDLVKAVLRTLHPESRKKFDLLLSTEAAPGSGLGSSSALMVATISAVSKYLGLALPSYSVAEMAYRLERGELKLKGGYQDQYASTFGGFNFIEFGDGKVVVNPLRIKDDIARELHACLCLLDLGRTRVSSDVLSRQVMAYEREDAVVMESLKEIKKIAYEMKTVLLKGDLTKFGELLGEEWSFKKKLDAGISNPEFDKLFNDAHQRGAIGGKILGAGDGGHALFYVGFDKKHDFKRFFESRNVRFVPFGFDEGGVASWAIDDNGVMT